LRSKARFTSCSRFRAWAFGALGWVGVGLADAWALNAACNIRYTRRERFMVFLIVLVMTNSRIQWRRVAESAVTHARLDNNSRQVAFDIEPNRYCIYHNHVRKSYYDNLPSIHIFLGNAAHFCI
jgi:hypothetical protein